MSPFGASFQKETFPSRVGTTPRPHSPGGISSHPRQQRTRNLTVTRRIRLPDSAILTRRGAGKPPRGRQARGPRLAPGRHRLDVSLPPLPAILDPERVRPRAVREGLARGAGSTSLTESPLAEAQGGSECDAPPAGGFSRGRGCGVSPKQKGNRGWDHAPGLAPWARGFEGAQTASRLRASASFLLPGRPI